MKARYILVGALPLVSLAALNCGDASFCEGAACGADDGGIGDGMTGDVTVGEGGPSDARADADGGDAMQEGDAAPPNCNTAVDISSQAACVTDATGLFVNASASTVGATGTKEAPFATIGAAVAAASSLKPNVFICAGTYPEQVMISKNVSLYGGFSCANATWTYATTNLVKVAPTAQGYSLEVTSVSMSTFEDIEFDAQAGAAAGASSIAVFASASTALFRRVNIVAAPAGPAPAGGATALNYSSAQPQASVGYPGSGNGGQGEQGCAACLLVATPLSKGGASGGVAQAGTDGSPSIPGGDNPGTGGSPTTSACGPGNRGADGLDAAGGAYVDASGSISVSGWVAAVGQAGQVAPVAQGGGGGSGAPSTEMGGGGGGGCGGCGGGNGVGGVGGGSSFAVLSFESSLTFDTCTLSAGSAGSGGPGADGQAGQLGGGSGSAANPGSGCPGGGGGNGSSGGGGSGGPGGLSAGVAYSGTAPFPSGLAGSTVSVPQLSATGGAGGKGGMPAAAAGRTGLVGTVLAL